MTKQTINSLEDVLGWCEAMFAVYKTLPDEEQCGVMEGQLRFAIILYERITGKPAPFKVDEKNGFTTYNYYDETLKPHNV